MITIQSQSQASFLLGGPGRRKPPGPTENQASEFPTRDTEFLLVGARASIEEIYPPPRAKSKEQHCNRSEPRNHVISGLNSIINQLIDQSDLP